MNCPVCGKSVPQGESAHFCPNCGSSLDLLAGGSKTSGGKMGGKLPRIRLEKEHIVITPPGGNPIRLPREQVENAAKGVALAVMAYITKQREDPKGGTTTSKRWRRSKRNDGA